LSSNPRSGPGSGTGSETGSGFGSGSGSTIRENAGSGSALNQCGYATLDTTPYLYEKLSCKIFTEKQQIITNIPVYHLEHDKYIY
jgi:hypothetical protein